VRRAVEGRRSRPLFSMDGKSGRRNEEERRR